MSRSSLQGIIALLFVIVISQSASGLGAAGQGAAGQNLSDQVSPEQAEESRPNIILILADDLGYSDLGVFGGEIATPTIDALAAEGTMFTNYHTAASCAPTRAMLLTGVDSHRNGVPSIAEAIPPKQKKHANYKGVLGTNVVTLATRLKAAGYHTYMTGKWHLGHEEGMLPFDRGFERTITMPFTGADNWEQRAYLPIYPDPLWFADGKPYTLPEDFYSSEFFIDKTISFIEENREDGKPFFSYIPFQAVHIPVQAPAEFTDRYKGRYDKGWEALRAERFDRAKSLGLVPIESSMIVTPGTEEWQAKSPEEQAFDARRMEVYAGMVEAMDHHIGRLVDYLKETGAYDNTIIIVTSDNGAEGSDPFKSAGSRYRKWLEAQGYTMNAETLGTKGSFNAIGANFATVSASPLAYYKFYTGEGGMRVPLIISGPGVTDQMRSEAFVWVADMAPTILEMAGVGSGVGMPDHPVEPMIGVSIKSLLNGTTDRIHGEDDVIGFELGGHKALFKGDYKLVYHHNPLGEKTWQLFNIKKDPGETTNLASQEPDRFATMKKDYEVWAKENAVLPVADDYDQVQQVFATVLRQRLQQLVLKVGGILIVLTAGIVFWRRRRRAG